MCVTVALALARHLEPHELLPGCEVLPPHPNPCSRCGFHYGLDRTHGTHLSFKAHDLQLFAFQGTDAKTVNKVCRRKKTELFVEAESRPSAARAF